jgi:hypothetical protein
MIVRDLDMCDLTVVPSKADAILIVDSDRVLTPAVSSQLLQTISRRNAERLKRWRVVDHGKLSARG